MVSFGTLLTFHSCLFLIISCATLTETSFQAKRLYAHLVERSYNKVIRPVCNASDKTVVTLGIKLFQLLDVDEKNQILTTNVWVTQKWVDPYLKWDMDDYAGVDHMYIPVEKIWYPDIVLYNTADGSYEMTTGTKARVSSNGSVDWNPPALLKSSCTIDVTYFPFDVQNCYMDFGSWTYDHTEVAIKHLRQEGPGDEDGHYQLESGLDMSEFNISVEWDVTSAKAESFFINYAGSLNNFTNWRFNIGLRRRFLFYTVNLIIPLISHAFITVLVFYLPADSRQKITLCISIFLSLTVFFLMLGETIPATNIVVPLLGKYLVFTLILVAVSVVITVMIKNLHYRSSATHRMSDWTRKVFLYWLPRLLMMRRPKIENSHDVQLKYIKLRVCSCVRSDDDNNPYHDEPSTRYQFGSKRTRTQAELMSLSSELDSLEEDSGPRCSAFSPEVNHAIEGALFIANHLKEEDEFNRTKEDWKYVALVVDRVFLWIYAAVCIIGTVGIICQAPSLYEYD